MSPCPRELGAVAFLNRVLKWRHGKVSAAPPNVVAAAGFHPTLRPYEEGAIAVFAMIGSRRWLARFDVRIAVLLAVSLLLRLTIVWRGGQFYWPDEARYQVSRWVAARWRHAEWLEGLRILFEWVDSLLFKLIAVVPALVETVTVSDPRIGAAFIALFSTANIAWVWRITRRAGGDREEAWAASLLTACATSLFYYARHLYPYDVSLFFLLGGLYAGLRCGWRPALASGVWVGLGFIAYNGYWQLGGAILVVVAVANTNGWRERISRAAAAFAGLVAPVILVLGAGKAVGADVVASYIEYSKSANVGNLDLGWRFIAEYLWYSEHGIALLWGACLVAAGLFIVCRRAEPRVRWWFCISMMSICAMFVLSDVAHKFVIHARTVRCVVPFLCLTTASMLGVLRQSKFPRWAGSFILAGIGVQAVANFLPPLTQVFPAQFLELGFEKTAAFPFGQRVGLRIQNAFYLSYPNQVIALPADTETVILERPHPLDFVPYLYEGFIRGHREIFRKEDLTMRVFRPRRTDPDILATERFGGYTGPLKVTLRLPRELPARPEPLLTTGVPEAGDFLNIVYETPTRIRVGLDHWGTGGPLSPPIRVDPERPVEIDISMGSLYPGLERFPALGLDPRLKSYLWVRVGGDVVLSAPQESWPSRPESVTVAGNWIGGGTTSPSFTGGVIQVENLPAGAVAIR